MDVFYTLLVLLVVTRLGGELAERLGQPAMVGELISGILLGLFVVHQFPGVLPAVTEGTGHGIFSALTDLGVFFLMLYAGVEMDPADLTANFGQSAVIAVGGVVVPFGVGFALGWAYLPASGFRFAQALFLGTALSITAIPVAAAILLEMDLLHSSAGRVVVSAAIVDDVIGIGLLAILTGVLETGATPGAGTFLWLLLKIALFFVASWLVAGVALPKIAEHVRPLLEDEQEFTVLIVVALAFALLADALGVHFILGAFMAGAFYTTESAGEQTYAQVREDVDAVTFGFLAPLFFASIGLSLELQAVWEIPGFVGLLIVAGIGGKLLGAGLLVRWFGGTLREAATVGFGMSARGAVEVIIADIALEAGLFSQPTPTPPIVAHLFSAVVIMAVATTLIAPFALRLVAKPDN